VQIPASYWLVQERDKRLFGLSLSVLSNIVAAVAPDDAVADLKNAAIDCVSRRDFLCGGRRLVIVNFQHQRQPIKRDLATRNCIVRIRTIIKLTYLQISYADR
jgi:hypothetical protein